MAVQPSSTTEHLEQILSTLQTRRQKIALVLARDPDDVTSSVERERLDQQIEEIESQIAIASTLPVPTAKSTFQNFMQERIRQITVANLSNAARLIRVETELKEHINKLRRSQIRWNIMVVVLLMLTQIISVIVIHFL